jgi:DNA-binding PadR family transcriptional regulator
MRAPEVTHLQFQILAILMGQQLSGQSVRDELRSQGIRKSGPGFYQLMARLEDAGFVQGWYELNEIDGQVVKERWYKLTAAGNRAVSRTREFYLNQFAAMKLGVPTRG